MPGPSLAGSDKLEVHITPDDGENGGDGTTHSSPSGIHHLQLLGHSGYEDGISRSPSRESFTTDLSLLSYSSSGSDVSRFRGVGGVMSISRVTSSDHGGEETLTPLIQVHDAAPCNNGTSSRHHNLSANKSGLLQVPGESYGPSRSNQDLLFEESQVIRNCSRISSTVLGLMKCFSTGDISDAIEFTEPLRNTVSEELLCANPWSNLEVPVNRRLDFASRSCSTWVAVGDMQSSTSQLPSPSTRYGSGIIPGFTAADLVCSVNKKVRQMYIRRRLMCTCRALETLHTSQLNVTDALQLSGASDIKQCIQDELRQMFSATSFRGQEGRKTPLTARDVHGDRGLPLTKYERNIMIFDWLHNLDDSEMPNDGSEPSTSPPSSSQQAAVQQAAVEQAA